MSADDVKEKETLADAERSAAAPDISQMMDGILANPELIGMVASAIGPMLKSRTTGTAATENEEPEIQVLAKTDKDGNDSEKSISDMIATLAPVISVMQKGSSASSKANDKRSCLLLALKPYLCRERCEAIDYMIRLARLSEIFKTMT